MTQSVDLHIITYTTVEMNSCFTIWTKRHTHLRYELLICLKLEVLNGNLSETETHCDSVTSRFH
jgi:hypothetical protein